MRAITRFLRGRLILVLAALILLGGGAARAQSACQYIGFNAVLTPGQWNSCFQGKQDWLGSNPLLLSGGVMTGKIITAASGPVNSGFNLTPGSAPLSPNNGDLWATSAGLFIQVNGATVGPLVSNAIGNFLPLGGGTMTGTIVGSNGGTWGALGLNNTVIGGSTPAAATFTTLTANGATTVVGASFGLSGNISSTAWTTGGVRYRNSAGTLTDTSSSGTVAAAYTDRFGGNTVAASSVTTYTNYFSSYFVTPVAGTNVTFTRGWALGADSVSFGTSNPLTVSVAGLLTVPGGFATSNAATTSTLGVVKCDGTTITCAAGVITAISGTATAIDAGGASTTVSNGVVNDIIYITGTSPLFLNKIPTANNAALATNSSGVPSMLAASASTVLISNGSSVISWSTTLPSGLSASSFSVSGMTVTSSFTATGLVTVADLTSPSVTVGGTTCTLGSSCTPTTTVAGATCNLGSSCSLTLASLGEVTTGSGALARQNNPTLGGLTSVGNIIYSGYISSAGAGYLCLNSSNIITFDGGGACAASDRRLKTNLVALNPLDGLREVLAMRPYDFDWLDANEANRQGPQIGLIAQDVIDLNRRLVKINGDETITLASGEQRTIHNTEAVDYPKVVVPLILAVQAINEKLKHLEEQPRRHIRK